MRVLAFVVAPVAIVTFGVVGVFVRSGHPAAAWLTVGILFVVGVAVARTATPPARPAWIGHRCDQLRAALRSSLADRARLADRFRWFARDSTIVLAVMWITCLVLLWALSSTDLLAVASRHMPVNPGGVDREALTAGAAARILDTLTVALPALLVLLIAAGALHRPGRSGRA